MPYGVFAGEEMVVISPGGQEMLVSVPEGCRLGDTVVVERAERPTLHPPEQRRASRLEHSQALCTKHCRCMHAISSR